MLLPTAAVPAGPGAAGRMRVELWASGQTARKRDASLRNVYGKLGISSSTALAASIPFRETGEYR